MARRIIERIFILLLILPFSSLKPIIILLPPILIIFTDLIPEFFKIYYFTAITFITTTLITLIYFSFRYSIPPINKLIYFINGSSDSF